MTAIILDGKKLATLSEEFIKKEAFYASFSWILLTTLSDNDLFAIDNNGLQSTDKSTDKNASA